jgi:[ribosomal protein S18]-alanine N-acetyltransferase
LPPLIRFMVDDDVEAVADLEQSVFSSWNGNQIRDELAKSTGISLVAVSATEVVQGWCCSVTAGSDAELLKLSVIHSCRRQGIAQALLKSLCSHIYVRECSQLFLEVRKQNRAARSLYAKLGWRKTGIRKNYYRQPMDDAIMYVRNLSD